MELYKLLKLSILIPKEDHEKIRERMKHGEKIEDIAKEYGIETRICHE